MSTLILRPNAVGDETALISIPDVPPNNYLNVDEETPDEDATFVANATAEYVRDLYNLEDTSQTGTINWIKVWIRCKLQAAKTAIKTGGTVYLGDEIGLTTSWTDYSTQYTEKPGGGAWTFGAVLNALQAGVALMGSGGKEPVGANCTQVWVEVDYTEVGWTHISKVKSVAAANITKVGGVAVASIAKIGGVAV